MNREIKFRAWGKKQNRMYNVSRLAIKPGSQVSVFQVEPGTLNYAEDYNDQYEFMQFTGLHDKNGKEIYEGDIVRTGDECGDVQYDKQQASFIILFQPHNKKQKSGCANLASTWPSPSKEVIGNIYENPELLKEAA